MWRGPLRESLPHVQSVPSALSAALEFFASGHGRPISLVSNLYWTVLVDPLVPSPSCPYSFQPHAQRLPSLLSAKVCSRHVAIAAQSVSVPIWTGVSRSVVVPSPNSPWSL